MSPINNKRKDTARRPSADFVARFKEQHFTPDNQQGSCEENVKKELNEYNHLEAGDLTHSMYPLFQDVSNGIRYDHDPTYKASTGVPFLFTPSLLDPSSSDFAAFAAQPPEYYTPTPLGSTTHGFQSYEFAANTQALNAPDLLSNLDPSTISELSICRPHPYDIDHTNYMHFRRDPLAQANYQELSIPGSVVGGAGSESSPSSYNPENVSGAESTDSELYLSKQVHGTSVNQGVIRNQDIYGQFRFTTTLHAATSMLRHSSDIPVTYLNKRQAYTISVIDESPAVQNNELKRYRTTVRITFDEENQRRTAHACWRLWKDGRGTLESGGNPRRLRAIDYEPIETRAVNDDKCNGETKIQVDEATISFDRFTVDWSSTSSSPAAYFCVRFLLLSTDFSYSKGVKGAPLRLIAKTEYLGKSESTVQNTIASELAYCKIKLFRDKGAERKLTNDRQQLKRAIEKLRKEAQKSRLRTLDSSQQISNKKRNHRSFCAASTTTESRTTSRQRRHCPVWSISSNPSMNSDSRNTRSQQDEAQWKLEKSLSLESMISSIRPVSVFSLIGDPSDDPDLSFSSITAEKLCYSELPLVIPLSSPDVDTRITGMMTSTPLSHEVYIRPATKGIDAIDLNHFYTSMCLPTSRPGTAVSRNIILISALCLYIAPVKIDPNDDPHTMHFSMTIDSVNDIYYAVYVPARSANALSMAIATKMGIDPTSIIRTTIINKHGLHIMLDDEVVREMAEKQEMHVAVRDIGFKTEHDGGMAAGKQSGLELFLAF